MNKTESNFLYHTHCDECNSSDANSIYDDGHSFCFSCNTLKKGVEDLKQTNEVSKDFISGNVTALSKRNIDFNTAQKFNYQTGAWFGRPCQISTGSGHHQYRFDPNDGRYRHTALPVSSTGFGHRRHRRQNIRRRHSRVGMPLNQSYRCRDRQRGRQRQNVSPRRRLP